MGENYCHACGLFARIDNVTKMCDRCYHMWLNRRQRRAG